MSRENWYRNTRWNDKIERTFFERLARSRTQRDQQLVIQALTLASHNPDATLSLVDHYFETRKSDFSGIDDVRAHLARAEAHQAKKKIPETIQAYKDVLARETKLPQSVSQTYVDLPYFIVCQQVTEEYAFALSLLEKGLGENPWPISHFKHHASMALIASQLGNKTEASEYAHNALAVAEVRKSGFSYHQNIGLVGKEHQTVIKKLVRLAGLEPSFLERLTPLIQGTLPKT